MSDKVLFIDAMTTLDGIVINNLDQMDEKNTREFSAFLISIFKRFNFARLFSEDEVRKVWGVVRENRNNLAHFEKIVMGWRLMGFDSDESYNKLVALIATSLTHPNVNNTLVDTAYLEPIPKHVEIEEVYKSNLWLTTLFVMSLCPQVSTYIKSLSESK